MRERARVELRKDVLDQEGLICVAGWVGNCVYKESALFEGPMKESQRTQNRNSLDLLQLYAGGKHLGDVREVELPANKDLSTTVSSEDSACVCYIQSRNHGRCSGLGTEC